MNKNEKEYLVQKIRTQYTEREHTELDTLRELDARVKKPAAVLAYTLGSIGAVVMGSGMSLVMTDIADRLGISSPMPLGIAVGIVGMAIVIANYPIYKKLLAARKKKYASEVIALSDRLMVGGK